MSEPPAFRRIVHVMRRFVPSKWGGTESVVFHLAREFTRLGIESPIYATAMFASPGKETFRGVQIHRFPYSLPWWGLTPAARQALELKGGNPFSLSMLRALWREKNADLFHAHVQHRLGGAVRFAARHHNIPYAVSIHGGHHTLPGEQTRQMLAPTRGTVEWGKAAGLLLGARRTLDDAGAIFCVGQDEYAAMRKERPAQPVHYQPNGVDLAKFRDARAEDFFGSYPQLLGKKIILCVSRVDPQKNQLLLVQAFARAAAQLPDHHLVLIGAEVVEDYGRRLREEIAACGLAERVTWIPGLPPDDPALPGAFRAAETFVLPSIHEPFGIVILEAWAASLPVIATRVGGIPGFTTDGENILLVPDGEAEALSAAILRLAASPGLGRNLAENGFALAASRYDWPAIARQLLDVYPQPKPRP
ncbi:MAG: glycosyltransferase family 4 protein [Terrimicrobiaceae bacterium]